MSRVRIADDFETIRVRVEELRRERARRYGGNGKPDAAPAPELPDAVAHVPGHVLKRYLAEQRRSSSR